MKQYKIITKYGFNDTLGSYNIELTEQFRNIQFIGFYSRSKLLELKSNMSDIILSKRDEFLWESIVLYLFNKNIRKVKEGIALTSHKGIWFFVITFDKIDKYEKIGFSIMEHYFFPFEQLSKVNQSMAYKILNEEYLVFKNIQDNNPNEDEYNFCLDFHSSTFITYSKKQQAKANRIKKIKLLPLVIISMVIFMTLCLFLLMIVGI